MYGADIVDVIHLTADLGTRHFPQQDSPLSRIEFGSIVDGVSRIMSFGLTASFIGSAAPHYLKGGEGRVRDRDRERGLETSRLGGILLSKSGGGREEFWGKNNSFMRSRKLFLKPAFLFLDVLVIFRRVKDFFSQLRIYVDYTQSHDAYHSRFT